MPLGNALISALIHWFLPASGRGDIIPLIVLLLAETLPTFTITHLAATLFVTFFHKHQSLSLA